MILTPEQADVIVCNLQEPERTLTLLAAGTGLRISECLGLQWQDIDFDGHKIYVRGTWLENRTGEPKSKASAAPVPMHPLLADSCGDGCSRPVTVSPPTGCSPARG